MLKLRPIQIWCYEQSRSDAMNNPDLMLKLRPIQIWCWRNNPDLTLKLRTTWSWSWSWVQPTILGYNTMLRNARRWELTPPRTPSSYIQWTRMSAIQCWGTHAGKNIRRRERRRVTFKNNTELQWNARMKEIPRHNTEGFNTSKDPKSYVENCKEQPFVWICMKMYDS